MLDGNGLSSLTIKGPVASCNKVGGPSTLDDTVFSRTMSGHFSVLSATINHRKHEPKSVNFCGTESLPA